MFSGLRAGSSFYMFDRKEPKLEIGEITFVSTPVPQMPTYNQGILSQPKTTVDIKARFSNSEREFKQIPSDISIATLGADDIVVSDNADMMISEIKSFIALNEKNIKGVDKCKLNVEKGKEMLLVIDPKAQQEAERDKEFSAIKEDVASLKNGLDEIKSLLQSMHRQ